MHDKEHSDVCEWSPLDCVLCKLPIAARLMHVRHHRSVFVFALSNFKKLFVSSQYPLISVCRQEHVSTLCQERPVRCSFACCDVTFPLSSRVNDAQARIASAHIVL